MEVVGVVVDVELILVEKGVWWVADALRRDREGRRRRSSVVWIRANIFLGSCMKGSNCERRDWGRSLV